MPRYDNILETIGNTPLVRLNRLQPAGVNVWVKVESFNPLGSVKDRMARAIIEDAEQREEALSAERRQLGGTLGALARLSRPHRSLAAYTYGSPRSRFPRRVNCHPRRRGSLTANCISGSSTRYSTRPTYGPVRASSRS